MKDSLTSDELELLDRLVGETIDPVEPPALVRDRILTAIGESPDQSRTIRAGEGKWVTLGPGVRTKRLSVDQRRRTVTFLFELEPMAIVPAHDHRGAEESYIVRGSCRIGAIALSAGDFHHAGAGSHHGDLVAAEEGCLLLVTVDLADVA